jgi:putative NIF3 family GTP cyclohydrolase 1 type 2
MKTVQELQEYLRGLKNVSEPSVDRIIFGDPEMAVCKIATCWMPWFDTLKEAKRLGANVVVAHEPTFYAHHDPFSGASEYSATSTAQKAYEAMIEEKRAWLEANHMAVIRCHDVLDTVEGFGIPYALAEFLGLGNRVYESSYYHVYEIIPAPAGAVVRSFLKRFRAIGQEVIQFYGDPNRVVQKIGIGTGCMTDPLMEMETGADFFLSINDTVHTWVQCAFSRDTGIPLAVIDHGAAEEPGVRKLSQKLAQDAGVEVIHLPQGCSFQAIV